MSKLTIAPAGWRALVAPLPDLVVDSVTATPANPTAGDQVVFSAVIRNQGNAPTSGGIGFLFKVDGNSVNWTTDNTGPLNPGATRTVTATNGASGGNYWVSTQGTHTITGTVNDKALITESDTTNNSYSMALTVAAAPTSTSGGGGTTSSSVLYGPDGTEWAPNSVSDGTTFDITVSTVADLLTAIANVTTAQANNGYRIGISGTLDLAPSAALDIPQNANLDAATKAILVRPVTPGTVKATNGIQVECSNLTLAYLELYGNFQFRTSPKNTWLARSRGVGAATINVHSGLTDTSTPGGSDCGVVGCIYPDYVSGGSDRIHISPSYSGTGHVPGHSMHNFSIIRSWFEGLVYSSGHADQVQIDGLTGTFTCKNSFMGPAGNNGNPQAKADIFWSVDAPFCTVEYDTCMLSGAQTDGQGNASNQSGPHRATNCVFYDVSSSMAFRFNTPLVDTNGYTTTPDCILTGCTFYGSVNGSGTGLTNTNPTFLPAANKSQAKPAIPTPPWQWW